MIAQKHLVLSLTSATMLSLVSFPNSAWASGAPLPANPDPEMKQVLDKLASFGGKPIEKLKPEEARKQPTFADAVAAVAHDLGIQEDKMRGLQKVEDISVQGAAGQIPARLYVPEGNGPFPTILYFHGGGFVLGNLDVYDASPRALAQQTGAIVLSVDYRKGPEAKFPAAHDDAFASYQWLLANGASFGADTSRIALVGESAGGNLALNVAMQARDAKIEKPLLDVLIYPVVGTDFNTESYQSYQFAKPLNKAMMGWFFTNYLNSVTELTDSRLNLADAKLNQLPPTFIITAELDPLHDEGKLLFLVLDKWGNKADWDNYNGVTHEFFGMAEVLNKAKAAQLDVAARLKLAFHVNTLR